MQGQFVKEHITTPLESLLATPVKHKHQTNESPSFPVSPPRSQLIQEEEEEEEGKVSWISQVMVALL